MKFNLNLTKLRKIPIVTYVYVILALLTVGGAFFLFVELAEDVLEEEKFIIDRHGAAFINSIQAPWLSQTMGWITELGSVTWLVTASLLVCVLIFFVYKRRMWRILYFATAMIGISVLTKLLKLTFERRRPDLLEEFDGTGFSFPSGHSTGPIVFYGFLIYLVAKSQWSSWIKWILSGVLSTLVLLIGFSRVYLSVHYVTDVLAGFALGLSWLLICILVLEYTLWRRKK
ncbi:phosphatase PAP2 family protein [Salibacterium salarium]|uniref:Phosphatase PAP2 family protein n=1 Tax=Salibacterium salarium TaxID=284579 RepID=A0A428N670_9BACI|nr:phosphatase PAP2 family protein [Salibacterium salarium]RSL33993.1 phosphatase PAP2 family protein [Salibacterium salarium]